MLKLLRPIIDCPTRWNSTIHMAVRMLQIRSHVCAAALDDDIRKDLKKSKIILPTEEQWSLLQCVVDILQPFCDAITQWSGQKYVTVSMVYLVIFGFLDLIRFNSNDRESVVELKSRLTEEVNNRFIPDWFPKVLPLAASLLNPRYKSLPFLSSDDKAKVKLYANVLYNMLLTRRHESSSSTTTAGTMNVALAVAAASSATSDLIRRVYSVSQTEQQRGFLDELEDFIRDSTSTDLSLCPLEWWKANATRYPRIERLAAELFCIPATSCPSERVFSTAGNVVNKKRAQLSPEHAEMLVFLYENSAKRRATSASSGDSSNVDTTDESEDSDNSHDTTDD